MTTPVAQPQGESKYMVDVSVAAEDAVVAHSLAALGCSIVLVGMMQLVVQENPR